MKITNPPNKINLNLRDGTNIFGQGLLPEPFMYPGVIAFISDDDVITVIPLDLVKKMDFYYEEEEEE